MLPYLVEAFKISAKQKFHALRLWQIDYRMTIGKYTVNGLDQRPRK
jgi:hypothetical protein